MRIEKNILIQWRNHGGKWLGVKTPFVANKSSYSVTVRLYECYKTWTSFILFSTLRLILNPFN